MKSSFDEFIKNIPKNIHSNTKSFLSKNVAIFIPNQFVIERKIKTIDYHFVIFHTTPPPINIDEKEFQFKKGSFISLEPGKEVKVNPIHSVTPVRFISICIKKDFFEKIATKVIDGEKIKFKKTDNAFSSQLLDLIEWMIKEKVDFGENYPLMIESIETQLAIQLLRDSLPSYLVHRKNRYNDNDYIDEAINYMEEYYSSNITIPEICNAIFLSPYHFQRIFKKNMDKTPYRFLMELRINKAKVMLIKDRMQIDEIARHCGFVSLAHFSTMFKRIGGVSPSEYRRTRGTNEKAKEDV
ncbi:MAG: AraC family transcriptional regulator [Tissierellales bacterium]